LALIFDPLQAVIVMYLVSLSYMTVSQNNVCVWAAWGKD